MMIKNKWNNKIYEVISQDENKVELEKVCESKDFPKIASLVRRSYDLH